MQLIFGVMVGALCASAFAFAAMSATFRLELAKDDKELGERLAGAALVNEAAATADSPQDIVAAAQADYGRLTAALFDEGYFGPVVTITLDGREASSFSPVGRAGPIENVVVRVIPGDRFRFGEARIGPLARGTELPEEFGAGRVAGTSIIKDASDAAILAWRDRGHAKAEPGAQQITARHPADRLDVALGIAPGPRLKFGDLIIEGNRDVRTERIRDIAGLPSGEVFSPADLALVQSRLRRTGTFRSITLTEAERIGPNDTLDITAGLIESPKRRFGFGAEISSLEGISLSSFWLHRNLLGGAERLRFDAEISGIAGDSGGVDFRLATRFDRPATFNEDTDSS